MWQLPVTITLLIGLCHKKKYYKYWDVELLPLPSGPPPRLKRYFLPRTRLLSIVFINIIHVISFYLCIILNIIHPTSSKHFTFSFIQTRYDYTWIIYTNQINNDMTYEHEITFNNDDLYYLTSTTNYLNDADKQFLIDEQIDLTTIKSILTYKL